MAQVQVRFFAVARDRLNGIDNDSFTLPDASSETAIKIAIAERYPAIEQLLKFSRLAHNHAFIRGAVELSDGDELAVIPPVSGG
ncbi:MAG: MoaD/ThiS family protein [Planctomycetota bacterium]|jgi:molybdopterin converting factor small subunit|nr:MoaD/ThiS family protein [Planctomycetota bacterium]